MEGEREREGAADMVGEGEGEGEGGCGAGWRTGRRERTVKRERDLQTEWMGGLTVWDLHLHFGRVGEWSLSVRVCGLEPSLIKKKKWDIPDPPCVDATPGTIQRPSRPGG
jgi:hypothetical protein